MECVLQTNQVSINAGVARNLYAERHPEPPKRTLEDVLNDLASVGERAGVPSHTSLLLAELRRLLDEKGGE